MSTPSEGKDRSGSKQSTSTKQCFQELQETRKAIHTLKAIVADFRKESDAMQAQLHDHSLMEMASTMIPEEQGVDSVPSVEMYEWLPTPDEEGDLGVFPSHLSETSSRPHQMMSFLQTKSNTDLEHYNLHHRLEAYGLVKHGGNSDDQDLNTQTMKALRQGNRGCFWKLAAVMAGDVVQSFILVLIITNLVVMWIDVDAQEGSSQERWALRLSFGLAIAFGIEALANIALMVALRAWKVDLVVDSVMCVIVLITEIITAVGADLELRWLTVLRVLRVFRFLWKLRTRRNARVFRIMLSSVSSSLWHFLFSAWLLATFLLVSSLLAALAHNGLDLPDDPDSAITNIMEEWFPSVIVSFATFLQIYLGAFDHATVIVMPLLEDSKYWFLGVILILQNFFMVIFMSTLITGLFVEHTLMEAEGSDAANAKEVLSKRSITFEDLLTFWNLIDVKGHGVITFDQFDDALRRHASLDAALGIHSLVVAFESGQEVSKQTLSISWRRSGGRQTSSRREREQFFKSLDFLGEGEVTFSDFVYGILNNVAPARTIHKLVQDHNFMHFIRSCGHACKTTINIHTRLKERAIKAGQATNLLYAETQKNERHLEKMKTRLAVLTEQMNKVCCLLEPSWLPETVLQAGRMKEAAQEEANAGKLNEVDSYIIKVLDKLDTAIKRSKLQTGKTKQVLSEGQECLKRKIQHLATNRIAELLEERDKAARAAISAAAAEKTVIAVAKAQSSTPVDDAAAAVIKALGHSTSTLNGRGIHSRRA